MAEELKKPIAVAPVEMSDEHPGLTVKEVEDAKARAKAKIDKLKKTKAIENIEKLEAQRLEAAENRITGVIDKDEKIFVTLNLPDYAPCLTVDFFQYYHGQTYELPRHMVKSLKEMEARAWDHSDEVDGKLDRNMYRKKREQRINYRTGAVS